MPVDTNIQNRAAPANNKDVGQNGVEIVNQAN